MQTEYYAEQIIAKDAVAWVQTFLGKKISLVDMDRNDYHIEDIAHALSMQCRYNGHTKKFYSVAEHCIYVSRFCSNPLEGLLHDASEAYLGDMVRPLKRMSGMEEYSVIEDRLQASIFKQFDLCYPLHESVIKSDYLVFVTEVDRLMNPIHPDWKIDLDDALDFQIKCLSPSEARAEFLIQFNQLSRYNEIIRKHERQKTDNG